MKKLGFIGAGNMGGAMISAAAKSIGGENILITDHNQEKMDALKEKCGCEIAAGSLDVAKNSEFVVLAVKPNVIRSLCEEIAPVIKEDLNNGIKHVIVSIAAGITTDTIRECIGCDVSVLRLLPNTPVAVGAGMILMTAKSSADPDLLAFQKIMSDAGESFFVPEEKMDNYSSVSGCTPAYAYMFIQSLADGAVQMGVPRKAAIYLAAQTVLGSAKMVLESGEHPDKLKDDVCSPGGSTIEGVSALEEGAFRYTVAQSIARSTEKNKKLGK